MAEQSMPITPADEVQEYSVPEKGFCRYKENNEFVCSQQTGVWPQGQPKKFCDEHHKLIKSEKKRVKCKTGNCDAEAVDDKYCAEHIGALNSAVNRYFDKNNITGESTLQEFCGYFQWTPVDGLENITTPTICLARAENGRRCATHQVVIQQRRNASYASRDDNSNTGQRSKPRKPRNRAAKKE